MVHEEQQSAHISGYITLNLPAKEIICSEFCWRNLVPGRRTNLGAKFPRSDPRKELSSCSGPLSCSDCMWNTIRSRRLTEMGTQQWGVGFTLVDGTSGLLWCFPWCNCHFLALFVLEILYIVCYGLNLFPSDRQTCVEGRWCRTHRESSVMWGWRQRLELWSHKLQTI